MICSLINKWRMVTGPGMRTEHAMMSMFRKYDFDGSGKLEKDEFERCLKDMGIALSNLELQILCEKFDTDQDGYVQPKEFVAFMKGKRRKVVDGCAGLFNGLNLFCLLLLLWGTELSLSDSKLRKQHRNEVTNNTLLQSIRETASAAGGGGSGSAGTTVHPDIKALKAKIKAQQDEMEALNKFLSRRK